MPSPLTCMKFCMSQLFDAFTTSSASPSIPQFPVRALSLSFHRECIKDGCSVPHRWIRTVSIFLGVICYHKRDVTCHVVPQSASHVWFIKTSNKVYNFQGKGTVPVCCKNECQWKSSLAFYHRSTEQHFNSTPPSDTNLADRHSSIRYNSIGYFSITLPSFQQI